MPVIEVPMPDEVAAYTAKLRDVVEDFRALGHGSRLAASFATGITQTNVSAVLNLRTVNKEWLDKLADWARGERASRGL